MADNIRATPQNATLGAIADFLKQTYAPQRTQQMQGVAEFLSVPAVARTLERLSYGQPITNVNKANVPLLPDDTAETAMVVGPMAGPLARIARRVGTNLVQTAPYVARDIAQSMTAPTRSYVVKPKGGNWLQGGIEAATQPLKAQGLPDLTGTGPLPLDPQDVAINRWIDTKLNKYIRNEMATPQDPVRALAEKGVLHVDPEQLNFRLDYHGRNPRPTQEFLAQSDAAKMWEGASDNALLVGKPDTYLKNNYLTYPSDEAYRKTVEENPWLKTVPEDTKVYSPAESEIMANDLGFDHLIDELKFSMDPESGLPDALRFDPKDIDKITVPQAVERVSQINAWRAKQAAEAEKAGMLGNLQAEPRLPAEELQLSFVGKPGGAWVDIPNTVTENGLPICNSIGKAGGWCTQHRWAAESYGSGPNRLTTLLDTEGRPHAQAKLTNEVDEQGALESVLNGMTPEQETAYMAWAETLDRPPELEEAVEWMQEQAPDIYRDYYKVLQSQASGAPTITELKPVGNGFDSDRAREYIKRDPAYKEKVTQSVLKFLNSGDWGAVKDLHHYDIVDLKDPKSVQRALQDALPYHLSMERAGVFNDAIDVNPNAPRFMTPRQLRDFIGPVDMPDTEAGFQAGGIVKGAVKGIGEMVEKYLAKEAPKEQKMLMGVYRGYAGEAPGETVYHAGAAFTEPRPGLFTTPERTAAEQFQRFTGAPRLHTLEAKPRRTGTDEDVYAMAKRLGIYNPGVPAGQYLEQGENAVFPEAAMMVEELRGMGLDSLRLKDGISKKPSLVALDPAVVRPAPELFATPQRRVADYYAQKRAAQTGERPHVEMLLVDPFAGRQYGHSTMGTGKQEPMTTKARKLKSEDVQNRTQLYAAGGLVNYDPNEIDTIVSQLKEEFHA